MKKVAIISWYDGSWMTANMDADGNLSEIEARRPCIDDIKKLPAVAAKQPRNGITLQHNSIDNDHTTAYVLPENVTSNPHPKYSEVVITPIFSNVNTELTKGSDAANNAIYGEGHW